MRNSFALLYAALLCGSTLAAQAATPATDSTPAPSATTAQQEAAQEAGVNTDTADSTLVSFAPVDGARFERLLTSQSSNSVNGDPVSIRAIRTQVEERWEKSGDQWLLHCTPTDVNVQNEVDAIAKIEETLLNQPYTVVFNANGEIVEVRGFDDISQKLKDALPQDAAERLVPILTPESMRASIARSQNYQFNWLYGKGWKLGEQHDEQVNLPANNNEQITINKTATVSAIDPTVLILSLQSDGKTASGTLSEKGTATIACQSGQLQQLQRTLQLETTAPDANEATVARKSTEVLTITWTQAD